MQEIKTINNGILEVKVSNIGGELQSIKDIETGREYLHNGDEKWWTGRAPNLFPVVGRLKNDCYTYNGKTYKMAQHGFIRKNPMVTFEASQNYVTHKRAADKDTFDMYPFDFEFYITHRLKDRSLFVSYTVVNNGDTSMPFSVGAHPAFAAKLGDKILLKGKDSLNYKSIEGGLVLPDKHETGNTLILDEDLFKNDVLIFEESQLSSVSLADGNAEYLEIKFDIFPYCGIWSKPCAPFVCLEPWFGVADSVDATGEIVDKKGIIILPPKESFFAELEIILK